MDGIMKKLEEIEVILDKLEKRIALVEHAFDSISIENPLLDLDSDDWRFEGDLKGERKIRYNFIDLNSPERLKKYKERTAEKMRKITGETNCTKEDVIFIASPEKLR